MPIGRTRLFADPRMARHTLRELDRRKPAVEPSFFNDNSERPAAENSAGRFIFVGGTTDQPQYSDGAEWRPFLSSTMYAIPATSYGTAFVEGTSTSVIRSDATLKFPTAVMSSANLSTLTLTDDAIDQTLTGSLGNLNINPAGRFVINLPNSTSASVFQIQGNATNSEATVANVTGRAHAGARSVLVADIVSTGATTYTAQKIRGWDCRLSGGFAGVLVGSTIIGYGGSAFSITPGVGSDTANKVYYQYLNTPQINNATGGFTEIATSYLEGPKRLVSNPTVTLGACQILECATISATEQGGLYIKQRTAQQTAATRFGLKIDTHNSGTARRMLILGTDPSDFNGNIQQPDSVKWVGGTGLDAELYYDGTNLILDPDVVGTGVVNIGATGDDDMHLTNIEIDGALNHDGTTLGVFNTAPTTVQTVTGSRGGNAALASLLTGLAAYGLIVDSTTA